MATFSHTSKNLSFLLILLCSIITVLTQLTSPSEASSSDGFISESTHASLSPSPTPAPSPLTGPHAPAPRPPLLPFQPLGTPMERRLVAVQGVVYCKSSCKYAGVDTLLGASPLLGAAVKLECNNTNQYLPTTQTAMTDKNGYFYLEAPRTVTSYAFHKCKAHLVSSPLASCSKPSPLHGGSAGAVLRPEKPIMAHNSPFALYTVGPFAFEPQCPHSDLSN